MQNNFSKCLELLLKSEGGFTDDIRDPGNKMPDGRLGSTMLGVTQANWENFVGHPVTHNDMKALTHETVGNFYKSKYWNPCYCDVLPNGLDYLLFDFGVNAGTGRSVKLFQQAIGVVPDGVIGPRTMAMVTEYNAANLIEKFSTEKELFYKGLKTFSTFGKGWLNRVEEVKRIALDMAKNS